MIVGIVLKDDLKGIENSLKYLKETTDKHTYEISQLNAMITELKNV